MKRIQIIMLMLLAVILGACAVMEPLEAPSSGMVRISIADNKHRTIIPTEPDEFTKYSFDFEALDGQAAPERQWLADGETELEVGLMPGNWVIIATGYAHITGYETQGIPDGDYPAAQGTAKILVEEGEDQSVPITLEGGVRPDEQGVLDWDVTLPSATNTAFLQIMTLGGEPVLNEDLTADGSGSRALPSGFYLLVLRINGEALRTEALHIYGGMASIFEWRLRFDNLDKLALYLGGMPANTPDTPYDVELESNLSLTDLNVYNVNLNDPRFPRYVNLDLSGCTGDTVTGLTAFNKPYVTGVVISDNVTSIANNAFQNCTNLAEITLPESLTAIGSDAFSGCTSLNSVTVSAALTSIGIRAFQGCTSLEQIDLSSTNVTLIPYGTFYNCTNLADVKLPSGLTILCNASNSDHNGSFENCASLKEINIPASVTEIGAKAFRNSGLTEITLPASVYYIGSSAFRECTSLAEVTIEGAVSVNGCAFNGCTSLTEITLPAGSTIPASGVYYYGSTTDTGAVFANCTSLVNVTLPNNLYSFGTGANSGGTFMNCTSLVEIDLSATNIESLSVSSYTSGTFENCANLERVILPDTVRIIGASVFKNCTSLREIELPYNVISIWVIDSSYGAFYGCANLEKIIINSVTPPANFTADIPPFDGTPADMKIYVPDSAVYRYIDNAAWWIFSSQIYPMSALD